MRITDHTSGIRDPENADVWLVRPWPVDAGFCAVVRHFLTAYVWPLRGDQNTARQLAYFEGYQAALLAASTDELRDQAGLRWRDELLGCVGDCVAQYRQEVAAQHRPAPAEVRQLRAS